MNALYNLRTEKDLSLRNLRYAEFIQDPLGEVAKNRKLELLKEKKIDEYDKQIKIIQDEQISKIPKKSDIDMAIDLTLKA